jgi:hypothetical protein
MILEIKLNGWKHVEVSCLELKVPFVGVEGENELKRWAPEAPSLQVTYTTLLITSPHFKNNIME